MKYYISLILVVLLVGCKSIQIFNSKSDSQSHFYPYCINNKWGFNSQSGDVLIKAQFEEAYLPNYGLAKIKKNGKYGFVNKKGKYVVKPKFDNVTNFKQHGRQVYPQLILTKAVKNGKVYFINQYGETIKVDEEEILFSHIDSIDIEPTVLPNIIRINDKYELAFRYLIESDESGDTFQFDTTSLNLDTAYTISNSILICKKDKYGIAFLSQLVGIPANSSPYVKTKYNKGEHQIAIDFIYDEIEFVSNYDGQKSFLYLIAKKNNYWGVIGFGGTEMSPFTYLSINTIENNGIAIVEYEDGKFGALKINSNYTHNRKLTYSIEEFFIR